MGENGLYFKRISHLHACDSLAHACLPKLQTMPKVRARVALNNPPADRRR